MVPANMRAPTVRDSKFIRWDFLPVCAALSHSKALTRRVEKYFFNQLNLELMMKIRQFLLTSEAEDTHKCETLKKNQKQKQIIKSIIQDT